MFTDQLCRVFISYTGQDLKEFAKTVAEEIRQWQWIAVDHKDWDATGERSVKECRECVQKSDALIVIVAHRYGWVPSEAEGGNARTSITELEVQWAKAVPIPVLSYIVNDTAPWPPDQIEGYLDPKVKNSLDAFKQELLKDCVGFFSDPSSLRGMVARNLVKKLGPHKLGVSTSVMQNFFRTLEKKETPMDNWGKLLDEIAYAYKGFQAKLQLVPSYDEQMNLLKKHAEIEWDAGNYGLAEELLNKATARCLCEMNKFKDEAEELERLAKNRREVIRIYEMGAAASQAANGDLLMTQLSYAKAAGYFQKAVSLLPTNEQALSADYLNAWGVAAWRAGDYREAVQPFEQALTLQMQLHGPHDPHVASTLSNLAAIYDELGHFDKAEILYRKALNIHEQTLGLRNLVTARTKNNLATLLSTKHQNQEAETLYEHALDIRKHLLGLVHPDTATTLNNLAALYASQGKYEKAEPLYAQALEIDRDTLGATHPHTANDLNNLAALHTAQQRYQEAEPFYKAALGIRESILGLHHPSTAISLNNLAELYRRQGRLSDAETLLKRAVDIVKTTLEETHPSRVQILENYATVVATKPNKDVQPLSN